jgi:hypothetical protein
MKREGSLTLENGSYNKNEAYLTWCGGTHL